MKRKIIAAVLLLAVAGAGAAYAVYGRASADEGAVETATATRGDLVERASASGTVEPDVQVAVKSRQSGEVVEVLVTEGDHVEAGQLLVRLDPIDAQRTVREAEVALDRARADLNQARASLTVAEAEAREAGTRHDVRARGAELGLVSTEDRRSAASSAEVATATITLRRAQVSSAAAQVETARLTVDDARRRLAETEIRAPISGTVLAVDVERGSIVASGITNVSGGTTLMTVADLADLRVVAELDEALVGRVRKGQAVEIRVDAHPTRTFDGVVHRVSPLGVEASNVVTFDVEVIVTDRDAALLLSGMSADLEIVTERHDGVVLIPVLALRGRGGERFVTLASGERRDVEAGPSDGTLVVVRAGLEAGEEVVRGGAGPAAAAGTKRPAGGMPFGPPRGGR
jgi:HlyD family secretion protein